MNVHHQCKNEVPDDCKPSKKRITKGMHIPVEFLFYKRDITRSPASFLLVPVLAAPGTPLIYDLTQIVKLYSIVRSDLYFNLVQKLTGNITTV